MVKIYREVPVAANEGRFIERDREFQTWKQSPEIQNLAVRQNMFRNSNPNSKVGSQTFGSDIVQFCTKSVPQHSSLLFHISPNCRNGPRGFWLARVRLTQKISSSCRCNNLVHALIGFAHQANNMLSHGALWFDELFDTKLSLPFPGNSARNMSSTDRRGFFAPIRRFVIVSTDVVLGFQMTYKSAC